ncbi:hypothetical protein C2U71_25070 [Burkholderia ubonensis]|nr:hypothetical protein C2U71_25070 [Burkholderia ubonensis]
MSGSHDDRAAVGCHVTTARRFFICERGSRNIGRARRSATGPTTYSPACHDSRAMICPQYLTVHPQPKLSDVGFSAVSRAARQPGVEWGR